MSYEWFNRIDEVVWHLEERIETACREHPGLLGAAPSAGDEARKRLRERAAAKHPLALADDVEDRGLKKKDVDAASDAIAASAVTRAVARGSRHVTREDVASAIREDGGYPYL